MSADVWDHGTSWPYMTSGRLCPDLTIDVTGNDLAMQDYASKSETHKSGAPIEDPDNQF